MQIFFFFYNKNKVCGYGSIKGIQYNYVMQRIKMYESGKLFFKVFN